MTERERRYHDGKQAMLNTSRVIEEASDIVARSILFAKLLRAASPSEKISLIAQETARIKREVDNFSLS